ncbi:MAG: hypothetical protein PHP40_05870, partial [Eubacteriales bacterium]|nr:hypothetical protein [Eubacteriales bacterium]
MTIEATGKTMMEYYDSVRLSDLRELVAYAAETHSDKVAIREFNTKRELVEHTDRQLQLSDADAVFYSQSQAARISVILEQCPDVRMAVKTGYTNQDAGVPDVMQLIHSG